MNEIRKMLDNMSQEQIKADLISINDKAKLYKWFGSGFDMQDNNHLDKILATLQWCYKQQGKLDYLPRNIRSELIENAANKFEISTTKLVQLYIKHEQLFDEQKIEKETKLISFEGIDGSGKTIQIGLMKNLLINEGYSVLDVSFPAYESFFGKEIGVLLSGKYTDINATTVDPKSMSLWYGLDRWREFQEMQHEKYDYILLNRFTLSSAVYQSIRLDDPVKRKELMKWVFDLEHSQLGLPVPDIYVIFDVTPNKSTENILQKGHRNYIGESADVYERSNEMMYKARDAYLQATDILNNVVIVNSLISGSEEMKKQEDIHAEVIELLKARGIYPNN